MIALVPVLCQYLFSLLSFFPSFPGRQMERGRRSDSHQPNPIREQKRGIVSADSPADGPGVPVFRGVFLLFPFTVSAGGPFFSFYFWYSLYKRGQTPAEQKSQPRALGWSRG